jgi:hypothetical protein
VVQAPSLGNVGVLGAILIGLVGLGFAARRWFGPGRAGA